MSRAVHVLDTFLYPRHVGFAPIGWALASMIGHSLVAMVVREKLAGLAIYLVLASYAAGHLWMAIRYRRDPFCQYAWLNYLSPPDYTKGPTVTGPTRRILWSRTRNLGGSAGRRYTV